MKGSQDSGVSKNLQKIQRMQDVGETADPQEPPLESALLKDKEKILEPEAHSSLQGTGQQLAEPSASKSTLEHSKMAVSWIITCVRTVRSPQSCHWKIETESRRISQSH